MKTHYKAAITALALAAGGLAHSASTKDIVLDRISMPIAAAAPATVANDALAVSVLLESPDGTLTPRSTNTLFHTGDRFRVKLLSSRDAKVSLYNTNPRGELSRTAIWEGTVKVGLETITPRLKLEGSGGVDLLHVVLEPKRETGVFAWVSNWVSASKEQTNKDIRLDVQNTPSATYLLSGSGEGLITTIRIAHR